jgi:hypothetical protein
VGTVRVGCSDYFKFAHNISGLGLSHCTACSDSKMIRHFM